MTTAFIGKIVHFHRPVTAGGGGYFGPRAAIMTGVHTNGRVDVQVFPCAKDPSPERSETANLWFGEVGSVPPGDNPHGWATEVDESGLKAATYVPASGVASPGASMSTGGTRAAVPGPRTTMSTGGIRRNG